MSKKATPHVLTDWEKAALAVPINHDIHYSGFARGNPLMNLFEQRQLRTAEFMAYWESVEQHPDFKLPCDVGATYSPDRESPTLAQVMSMNPTERLDYHGRDRYPDFPPSDFQQDKARHDRECDTQPAIAPPPPPPAPKKSRWARFWHRVFFYTTPPAKRTENSEPTNY